MILHDEISRDEVLLKKLSIQGNIFEEVCKRVLLAKKLNTSRRLLKEIMASYEQKKEF